MRVRLIRGKTELILGMHIVKKLAVHVCVGSDRCKVGKCEWEMMTFDEKHLCVFSLVPTSCAYAISGEYFGKLQKRKLMS